MDNITLYSVCVQYYTVQCLCTVSLYSVCVQYYTVQCLCTVLHCTVSVCSITVNSVCVQYYTVLFTVLQCTMSVYCITLYIYHSPNAQQIYHNKIWKVQIITKLTTMITRKSWEKLILTNLRRCERDSNPWIDCINWNRKGRGRRSNLRQKFYEIFQNILTILTFWYFSPR